MNKWVGFWFSSELEAVQTFRGATGARPNGPISTFARLWGGMFANVGIKGSLATLGF
jgi:hypothetical protein